MSTANATTNKPTIETTVTDTSLVLTFSNGEVLTVDVSTLNANIQFDAMIHGLRQKLVDAAAISRNPETGRSATVGDKFAAVRGVYDRIVSEDGTWNKGRTGESGGGTGGQLLKALMELTGKSKEEISEYLADKTPAQKTALRKNEKVAPIIIRMQAASSKINSNDLLSDLM